MENNFNPLDWIDEPEKEKKESTPGNFSVNLYPQVEQLVEKIEAACIDLTTTYTDWCKIGFALSDELGEAGRDLYHRLSRFHPGYNATDCDKQYDQCLKGKRQGITINSLFYLAKDAGIMAFEKEPPRRAAHDPTNPDDEPDPEPVRMPTLFPHKEGRNPQTPQTPQTPLLPILLQKVMKAGITTEEKDLLFLGAMGCISACIPKVYGIYDGRRVYSNLYLFVTAPASAGKGRLVHCKLLVQPIHNEIRQQAKLLKGEYEKVMIEYNLKKNTDQAIERPPKPPEKMLFIPANNSSTGAYQLLSDSDGRGLIFETEGDTLAQAFKTDYGNYSDGFRKAFHHEEITYYRRGDREYVSIENTCLSTVLTGTTRQIPALIPSAENGLFSRFLFYFMNVNPKWRDVIKEYNDIEVEQYFAQLGEEFYVLYRTLKNGPERRFYLTEFQGQYFNEFFTELQEQYLCLYEIEYIATIRRLGLIAFRMCMILSVLRISEHGHDDQRIVCTDEDFETVLNIIPVLVKHAGRVFSEVLPREEVFQGKINIKEKLLELLPEEFTTKDCAESGKELKLPEKTIEKYVTEFCKKGLINRVRRGVYTKREFQTSINTQKGG